MDQYLLYVIELLILTLGVMAACGLVSWLARKAFMHLMGNSATVVFYASSIVGTPIHELGHALMCIPFGHRIKDMKLFMIPKKRSRTLGYVEHTHNRKDWWAVFGDLFISFGPIFSGIGVMVLVLSLCFGEQWRAYLEASRSAIESGVSFQEMTSIAFSLLISLFKGFGENVFGAIVGILIILSVAQHITLSLADLKGCRKALVMYVCVIAVFAAITMLFGWQESIVGWLMKINLPLLSLFCVSITFSLVWVVIALVVYALRQCKVIF